MIFSQHFHNFITSHNLTTFIFVFLINSVCLLKTFKKQNILEIIILSLCLSWGATYITNNNNKQQLSQLVVYSNKLLIQQYLFCILPFQFIFLYIAQLKYKILILFGTNLFFFILAISPLFNLHYQLLTKYQILLTLFSLVLSGFATITILDRFLLKLKRGVIERRKIFHFIPVCVIVIMGYTLNTNPYQISQKRRYIVLMLSGGFYIMLMLEIIRYLLKQIKQNQKQINSFNSFLLNLLNPIYNWMESFNDGRQNNLWITHLYLYLSLIIGENYLEYNQIAINISVIMILADAMAAIIGSNFGKHQINLNYYFGTFRSKKTYEGMGAFIFTTFILLILTKRLLNNEDSSVKTNINLNLFYINILKFFLLSLVCSIFQVISGTMDNVVTVGIFIFSSYFIDLYIFL